KKIKDMRATFALMSLTVSGIFALLKWILYIISIALIVLIFAKEISIISGIAWASIVRMLARIFRIAIFEIQEIKDGNLLTAIFSGVLSFVAVIIAIIALFIDEL
ncbi:MAG: hypothetical protein IJZ84_06625, partial [Lachnospiraceae bacterium]|nr:hypothetical protein [Lachnospiraceae bacterium]